MRKTWFYNGFKFVALVAIILIGFLALESRSPNGESAEASENWIDISTPAQLNNIRNNLSGNYRLVNDIDLSDWGNWEPIGSSGSGNRFNGQFDGQGHIIYNMTINNTNNGGNVGFFGFVQDASIKNVGFLNAQVTGHPGRVGALGGIITRSTIEFVYATGRVGVSGATSTNSDVGGLVGQLSVSTINHAYFEEYDVPNGRSGVTNQVYGSSGSHSVGGLVGRNVGSTVYGTYASTTINSDVRDIGGLIGYSGNGGPGDIPDVSNSYYNTDVFNSPTNTGTNHGEGAHTSRIGNQQVFGALYWHRVASGAELPRLKNVHYYDYETLSDDTINIRRYFGPGGDLKIPDKIDGKVVSTIGRPDFSKGESPSTLKPFRSKNITSVKLPKYLEDILSYDAFRYNQISSIVWPETEGFRLSSAYNAFRNNNLIGTLVIPENIGSLTISAFRDNDITEVKVLRNGPVLNYDNTNNPLFGFSGQQDKITIIGYPGKTNRAYPEAYAEAFGNIFVDGTGVTTFSRNGNSTYARSHSTKVDIAGVDESKSLQYAWSTSTSTPSSGWSSFTNGSTLSRSSGSGNYYLHIRGTNLLGKSISARTNAFRLDTTNPTLNLSASTTSPTKGNVTITATGSDTHSGVKRIRQGSGSWTNSSSMTHTVSSNGTYSFTVEDNAGNTRTQSITVSNIDKTAPTVSFSTNGSTTYKKSHSTKINVSDSGGSGLNTVQYQWTTGTSTPSSDWITTSNGATVTTPAGVHTDRYLHVRATDHAGNVTNQRSNIFRLDNQAPAQPTITAPTGWQTSNVSVTMAHGSDAGGSGVSKTEYRLNKGSWQTYSNAITISTNGTTTIEARTVDKAGNVGSIRTATVQLDKVNPTLNLSQNPASSTWTNGNVTITATGSDAHSGVKRIRRGSGSWVNSSSTTYTATSNGTHSFTVEDNAGRTTTQSIAISNIDKTLPTVSLSKNGGGWATAHSTTINASDAASGVKTVQYQWTTSTTTPTSGWLTGANGTSTNAPATSGNHYLHVRVTDNAGNVRTFRSNVFQIDRTAPTNPTISAGSGWQTSNVTVTITPGTDTHSGVSKTEYRLGTSGNWTTYTAPFVISTNGTTTIQARTVDNLNNISSTVSETVQLDKVKPELTLTPNRTAWTNQNVTISAAASDAHSGVRRIHRNGAWSTGSTTTQSVSSNGTYTFIAEDIAGNTTEKSIKIDNIDKIAPKASLSKDGGSWAQAHTTKVSLTDTGGSNVKSAEYRWTTSASFPTSGTWTSVSNGVTLNAPSATGQHYLHIRVTDHAGNSSQFTSKSFDIDNTKPTMPSLSAPADWQTTDISITLTSGVDNHSGVSRNEYRVNEGIWQTYSSAIKINGSGETKIEARTIDKAGNISNMTSRTVKLDKVKPDLTLTPSDTKIVHEDVVITATGSDKHSGVRRVRLPDNTWVSGNKATYNAVNNGTFHFRVEDVAGNITDKSITINNIDKTRSFDAPDVSGLSHITIPDATTVHWTQVSSPVIKDWTEQGNEWRLSVSATPIKGSSLVINPVTKIVREKGNGVPVRNLTDVRHIDDGPVPIVTGRGARGVYRVEFPKNAIGVVVDPTTSTPGTYQTTITWELTNAP